MEQSTESLRAELLAARARLRDQIDKLRARPYPLFGPTELRANGVMIDNRELIARLTQMVREIDWSLAGLGAEMPSGDSQERP
jgi:hypothetical protein